MNYTTNLTAFLFLLIHIFGFSQFPIGNAGEHTQVFIDQTNNTMGFGYYEYLPESYTNDPDQTYPIVLFFHGLGERGNGGSDLSKLLMWGPPKAINEGVHYDAIIVSPQTSSTNPFTSTDFESIFEFVNSNYPIDPKRIYVTGLSNGGGGTWNALSSKYYDKIAAVVPIVGAATIKSDVPHLDKLKRIPIWAHHTFDDPVIHRDSTQINVDRIAGTELASESVMEYYFYGPNQTAADEHYTMQFDDTPSVNKWFSDETEQIGAIKPQFRMAYTLYKNGAHGPSAWQRVYENPEVWEWLLSKNLDDILDIDTPQDILNEVSLSPNPASDYIQIQNLPEAFDHTITIYDHIGRKILEEHSKFQKNKTIEINSLSKGIYVFHITNTNTQKVYKIQIAN